MVLSDLNTDDQHAALCRGQYIASSWQALRAVSVIYLLALSQVHAVAYYLTLLDKNQKS
jgi:hypothetical protein